MVTRVVENENKPYLHYTLSVSQFKPNVLKLTLVDNYFDKSDYAFVDLETGELYSYNNVAFDFVYKHILRTMNVYELKAGDKFNLYTKPHSTEILFYN